MRKEPGKFERISKSKALLIKEGGGTGLLRRPLKNDSRKSH